MGKKKVGEYYGKSIIVGDKNLQTPNEIHEKDLTSNSSGGGSVASKWTGHADVEGLKAIGWTDEDIAYYQQYGVNWDEEDDAYHLVSEDNKALYGVLTADNISDYKDRIVYLPKIDTSGVTDMYYFFNCKHLVAIPEINTSNATDVGELFYECYNITSIPMLDFSNATSIAEFMQYTYNLRVLPPYDLTETAITSCNYMCASSYALERIENLILPNGANWNSICSYDSHLNYARIDVSNAASTTDKYAFADCVALVHAYIKGLKCSLTLASSALLSKDSLLYIINNEASTSAITITLHASAYSRLATDPDIVAALANHPNVSLTQ